MQWLRVTAAAAACSAVIATGVLLAQHVAHPATGGWKTGHWLARSSRPGDTVAVLYGHAEVNENSGMPSPYPFMWSLPMRTIDPHLAHFRALLVGPHRPDWVVIWSKLDEWNMDANGRARLDLATHYRLLHDICGHHVWLADGDHRNLARLPHC